MDFKNKVVIITGASVGIGEATAYEFANLSAKLVLVARNEKKLKEVAKTVKNARGIEPLVVKADLTEDADVKKIVDETIKHFGQIDVLINNAGAGAVASLKDGIEPLERVLNLNLRSVYLLTHLAAPHIIKTKGNIVNVSSIAAIKPGPNLPYHVSKAALDMFTKCIAKDLATDGVRVNSVNPGPVLTEFFQRLGCGEEATEEMLRMRREHAPLGKMAKSDEVAKLILFVASDNAKSITGSIYVIDNGHLLP